MQAAKMLGRKTGGGFYKYEGKQQTPNEMRSGAANRIERVRDPA